MDSSKLIKLLGGIVAIFVLLLLILWLVAKLKPKYVTYEELESKIVEASKKYVREHENKFPNDNAKYSLSYQTLVNGEYIKPLDQMLKNSNGCNANVVVFKQNGQYSFTPYLNCGENYKSIELYKQVLEDNPITTANSGLYRSAKGEYYFRGRSLNNYAAFGSVTSGNTVNDVLWQILSITPDNKIRMRAVKSNMYLKFYFDNRYNVDKSTVTGYNTFDDSFMAEKLKKLYEGNDLFTAEQKTKMSPRKLCIGTRTLDDTSTDGSTECSKMSLDEYYMGTITPYEFMRISTDEQCKTLKDGSCRNYNFLSDSIQSYEWTLTPVPDNSFQVYTFNGKTFSEDKANSTRSVYPVIELNEYAFYTKGDGSKENPYRIKMATQKKTKKSSN